MQLESLPHAKIIEIFAKSSLAFLQTLQFELDAVERSTPLPLKRERLSDDELAIQAWENEGGACADGPQFR